MSLQLVVPAESEYKRLNKLDMKPDVSKRYIADLTPMDAALLNEHAREAGLITAAGYCVKACDAELIKGPLGDLIFRQPHCIQLQGEEAARLPNVAVLHRSRQPHAQEAAPGRHSPLSSGPPAIGPLFHRGSRIPGGRSQDLSASGQLPHPTFAAEGQRAGE